MDTTTTTALALSLPEFSAFRLYATIDLCGGAFELWHLPRSEAKAGEARFLRAYPDGRWELVADKTRDAMVVRSGRVT